MALSRFDRFLPKELSVLHDALLREASSDDPDPDIVERVAIADHLLSEVSSTPALEPPRRWSVEVMRRGSWPRRSFWLDVSGSDEGAAVLVARAVLSELWGVVPNEYEFRAVEDS